MQGVRAGGRFRNRIGIGSRATGRSKSQNRGMAQFTLQMLPVSVKSFPGETPGTAERRSGTTSKRKATFWAESAFGTNWNLRLGKKLLCGVSYLISSLWMGIATDKRIPGAITLSFILPATLLTAEYGPSCKASRG
jgi:hypothetical protein